jgi:hypothetical protein
MNEAISKARAGNLEGSFHAFESVPDTSDFALEAVLGRCQVLEAMNRANEAFTVLSSSKDRWWDSIPFLLQYVDVGYRTANEDEAHQAFARIQELETALSPNERVLRPMTLDDLTTHVQAYNERREFLMRHLLQGRLPWLMVDDALRHVPYWAWAVRTQPLVWLSEQPTEWAQQTLYATHGFSVKTDEGIRQLMPLTAASPQKPIVADLSALITLHQLGLLAVVAEYFGKIVFPAQYLSSILDSSTRLLPHQLSRYTAPHAIRSAVEAKRITVVESPQQSVPILDEHSSENALPVFRLSNLAAVLQASGIIAEEEFRRLEPVCHYPATTDDQLSAITLGSEICIAR